MSNLIQIYTTFLCIYWYIINSLLFNIHGTNIKENSLFLHGILHQLFPQPSHCTYGASRLNNKYRATNLSGCNFVPITVAAGDKDRVLCLTHKATTWTTDGVGAAHNGCRIRVAPWLHSKTAISPRHHVNKLETSCVWNLVILLYVIKTRYPVLKQYSALRYKHAALTVASSHVTHPLVFTKSKASIIFGFSEPSIGSQDITVGIATMLRSGQATKLGTIPGMGKSFLISSKCPYQLCGHPVYPMGTRVIWSRAWSWP